jgi:hypothetical protein
MVYSIAAVICIVLLIAFCIVLKRTCITKKGKPRFYTKIISHPEYAFHQNTMTNCLLEVYKTEDKEERDSLAEAELEAGNKKEYFM